MSSVEYFHYKIGSHDTQSHCGYLITLVSAETLCENRLGQRLRFEPVAQPETGPSLRPFVKSAPAA